jgi:hypothetical protein
MEHHHHHHHHHPVHCHFLPRSSCPFDFFVFFEINFCPVPLRKISRGSSRAEWPWHIYSHIAIYSHIYIYIYIYIYIHG